MINANDFIPFLKSIIFYVVLGYIFLTVYEFVMGKKKKQDFQNVFLRSTVVGFVIWQVLFKLIKPEQPELNKFCLLTIAITFMISYMVAQLNKSRLVEKLLILFNIEQTIGESIWDIVADQKYPTIFRVKVKNKDEEIHGQFTLHDVRGSEDMLVLSCYKVYEQDGALLKYDYSTDINKRIIITASACEYIEIEYDKKSKLPQNEIMLGEKLCEKIRILFQHKNV